MRQIVQRGDKTNGHWAWLIAAAVVRRWIPRPTVFAVANSGTRVRGEISLGQRVSLHHATARVDHEQDVSAACVVCIKHDATGLRKPSRMPSWNSGIVASRLMHLCRSG